MVRIDEVTNEIRLTLYCPNCRCKADFNDKWTDQSETWVENSGLAVVSVICSHCRYASSLHIVAV